jgi:predicted metal-dependent hydrolase
MNKAENIVQYTDIGSVRYVYNKRARNLAIRISYKGEVRVTIPRYVSFRKAESFVMSRKLWISRKLQDVNHRIGNVTTIREGDYIRVFGEAHLISLRNGNESVEEAIWRILLVEAKKNLPGRVESMAKELDFRISGVKVRKMTTRWGSCTAKNSINLNSWLVMLPYHLSDYVILHELVHTVHRDHGPGFWKTMDKLAGGNSKELRRELRNEQIMLIHPEQKLNGQGN